MPVSVAGAGGRFRPSGETAQIPTRHNAPTAAILITLIDPDPSARLSVTPNNRKKTERRPAREKNQPKPSRKISGDLLMANVGYRALSFQAGSGAS
jgi:hypothetical protein